MSEVTEVETLIAREPQIVDLIDRYLHVRETLDLERKQFKSYESDAKAAMDLLAKRLGDLGSAFGVDSFKTSAGTAYETKKEIYRVEDWPTFVEYVVRTENYQLLEKRVAKNAAREILEETGEPPSGIFHDSVPVFLVRKPSR